MFKKTKMLSIEKINLKTKLMTDLRSCAKTIIGDDLCKKTIKSSMEKSCNRKHKKIKLLYPKCFIKLYIEK